MRKHIRIVGNLVVQLPVVPGSIPCTNQGQKPLEVTAKQKKFNPKPGEYFLLKWPSHGAGAYRGRTYRLVYIY